MAAKKRVFQVAKEFNISNEALIAYLIKLDFPVKTHMSPITEEMYDQICKKYRRDAVATDADYEFRKRLREKKIEEEKRKERAKRELEERIRLAKEIAKSPLKRKERSKEEVLKIAKIEAKAEAQAELRQKGREGGTESKREREILKTVPGAARKRAPAKARHEKKAMLSPEAKEVSPTDHKGLVSAEEPGIIEAKGAPPAGEKAVIETPEDRGGPAIAEKGESAKGKKDEKASEKHIKREGSRKKGEKAKAEKPAAKEATAEAEKKKRRRRKKKKRKISDEEIEASIKQTLAALEEGGRSKRRRHRAKSVGDEAGEIEDVNVIKVTEFISAADLAQLMDVEAAEVLKVCMNLGLMVTINQRLDMDTIIAVADEFGFEVEQEEEFASRLVEEEEDEEDLEPRPPVVTIMGHVDHGKTSLLDFIRRSNIIGGEAGGITQHIGAYEVSVDGRRITFLDTPGHEAFTAMRARGAQVTDIVILIVAADDGVQMQTIEAINHARAAGVPIVVAINKIDKPNANPDLIKQQLSQHGIVVEDWGGKYQCAEISAKSGQGVEKLLDAVLLEAELLELKANPNRTVRGIIIESELDRGKGPVATVLVQHGTLRVGDPFVAGLTFGKVRAMFDERGKIEKKAPPSTPVRVVGFSNVPQAGDRFVVMRTEKEAREISVKRQQIHREQEIRKIHHRTLDQISKQILEGEVRELRVIVKGDVDGSVEAIADSLMKLSSSEVAVDVIHKGVGGVSETDINLAAASDAIIIGFNVRVTLQARKLAEKEDIDIRIYKVIYDAVNDVKAALEGLLEPEIKEDITGTVEVRQTFKVPKIGTIGGGYVLSGKIKRNDLVRLYRDDKLVYEGKISSLKRFKDDAREVQSGFECGISIDGFDDIHIGDVIECYQITEIKRTL